MELPLGAKCIKYLLFTFNVLFLVSGIILISVGSVIKAPYSAYHYILDHGFFAVPVLLTFIGLIIIIVSFFGCCGAFKENYCMTITFGVLLILVFILEFSAGIAGYVLKDKVKDSLNGSLINSMEFYNKSSDVKRMWDYAQSTLHCCGVNRKEDWNATLPESCCPPQHELSDSKICPQTLAYNTSCYSVLENLFISNAGTLGGAGIGIAIIQILGILFSYSLATSIGKQYESLERDI